MDNAIWLLIGITVGFFITVIGVSFGQHKNTKEEE